MRRRVGRSCTSCARGTSASLRVGRSCASCARGTSASLRVGRSWASLRIPALVLLGVLVATPAMAAGHPDAAADRMELMLPQGTLELRLLAPGIVQLRVEGVVEPATPVIDPEANFEAVAVKREQQGDQQVLRSDQMTLRWNPRQAELRMEDPTGHLLLSADLTHALEGRWSLHHAKDDPQYGIGGLNAFDAATGNLLREGKQIATAGKQGHTGAPLVWSSAGYGVLVDGEPVQFDLTGTNISIRATRKDALVPRAQDAQERPINTVYLLAGNPAELFAHVRELSGASPMFPKWAMGFTNSQWGIDEQEALSLVDTYRAKHIPIDNFTFDFDWKAWGEDMGVGMPTSFPAAQAAS
jgi:alpha-glucosidase